MAEAQNPFAQLDADSAAQNPFAKLDGPDPGAMSDLVHGIKAGGVDLPKMAAESGEYIGHAAHALGAATNSDTLSDLGNAIVAHTSAWANSVDGGPGTEQSLQGQDGGFVRRNIYGVGRGLGQMAGAAATGAAVGGAVGSVVPGPGTVAGAATGASLALLVALPALFGGSTAESTLEKVSAAKVAEGQTPQQAENTGLAAGAITGTAAGAGQAILSKIGVGKALQPVIDNIGSAVAGSLVKTALTPTLKGFAKEAGMATVEGAAVNTGIQASVQGTEAGFGAGDGPTASGLIDAAVQGAAISGLAHGASSVAQTGKVNATTKMLGDVTADPNARADAMLGAAAVISIKSPEVAQDFATYAHNQIVNGLPIDVMPDAAYKGFADALRQQTPEQPAAVDPAAAAPQFVPTESEVAATAVPHLTDTVGGIFKATDVDGAIAAAEAAMHTVHTETAQNAATTRDGLLAEHQYYADQQDQAMRQQAFDKAQAEAPVMPAAPDNVFARHDEEQRVAEQAVRDAAFEKAQQQGDNVAQPSALSGAMTAEVTRLGNRNLNNLTTTQLAALAMHHPDPAVAEQAGQIASGRRNAAMVADTLKTPENVSTIDQTGAMHVGQTEPAAEFSTERAGEGVAAPVEVAAPARTLEATDAAVRPLKEATDADARARGQADSGTGFIPVTTEDLPDARTPASNGVSGATTLSKSEAGLLEKSAAIYGKKVQLFRQEGATNGRSLDGMVVPSQPDTIYVNADASGAHHLVVFGHELAHQMQTDAPHLYDGMQKALMKQVAKGGGNQFYRYYMNKGDLSDVQARQAMSDPAVKRRMTDEFIADLTGNRFSEAQTWRKLFADNATGSKSMVYRIADFMTSFIDKLLGNTKFKQFATDDMVKNLTDVRQTIRRSLSSYAQDRGSKAMEHEADMLRAKAENKRLVTPVKAEPRADVGKLVSKAAPAPVAERAAEPSQSTGTKASPQRESLDDIFTKVKAAKVAREATADKLVEGKAADASVAFTRGDGDRTAMAGPDASKPGSYRVTWFDKTGPYGHAEVPTLRDAVVRALYEGYTADGSLLASRERSTLENPVKENTDGRTTKDQAGAVTGRDAGATGRGDEGVGAPAVREDGRINLTHYSRQAGLETIDPAKHGTGMRGAESKRKMQDPANWVDRTYYGLDVGKAGGYVKESGVGPHEYTASVPAGKLYDIARDPEGLRPKNVPSDADATSAYEKAIKDAGYTGYWRDHPSLGKTAAVFDKLGAENGRTDQAGKASAERAGATADSGEQAALGRHRSGAESGTPGNFRRELAGDGHVEVGGRKVEGERWVSSPEHKAALADLGASAPNYVQLKGADAGKTFADAIMASKMENPMGASVHVYTPEEYAGMKTFVTDNGKAGVAVKPDGDIVSVFNTPGSDIRRMTQSALDLAVQHGGTKLDAFDTVLPKLYAKSGFEAVARMKWNEEYAPPGWEKAQFAAHNGGEPDVVFMAHKDGDVAPYKAGDGKLVTDYDEGVKLQDEAVQSHADSLEADKAQAEADKAQAATSNPFSDDPQVRASGERALFLGKLDPAQEAAARAVGALARPKTVKQKMIEMKTDLRKKMVQGIVDQFSPIKAVSDKAYMMARMSKGTDGALEALMLYGHVTMRDGLYDVNVNGKGFSKVMASLDGEHGRFFLWVAAQRAEMLKAQGKENLFTDTDISALKTLDAPDAQHPLRAQKFDQALKDYNDFNDSVLKIAEDSGLLDAATRQLFKNQPYVPFYRVMDDEGMKGPMMKSGLVNQYAFKKLKGGGAALNQDLLANTLTNWGHLLGAASRNRAAVEAMTAAEKLGVADKIPASQAGKGTIRVLVGGKDVHYEVNDPHLLSAVSAMAATVPSWMKPLSTFKHLLTTGVTLAPGFKIRNLIRDTVSSIAIGDISANPAKNIVQGFQGTSHKSQTYASMLASGGIIRMGSMLDGNTAERAHRLIESGVDRATILDSQGAVKVLFDQAHDLFEAYQELGDRSENINRAALYQQLIAKGKSHAEASFMARDLMDFSMGGNWPVVKFLTQSVPFLNARIQGLYKLGKASTENPGRVVAVIGAVSMASLALMWKYQNDPDWKAREDFDRDNYWWFKIGSTAFRIPKPFEVGAAGTVAERTWELFNNKEMTGSRYMGRIADVVGQQFSMNPTPQIIKPFMDVYSNKDSFTGRPIEGMALQKLQPEDRYSPSTSMTARFLGQLGLPDPTQFVNGRYTKLSPVQVDSLLHGYFGWLGTLALGTVDTIVRPMTNEGARPARTLSDYTMGFADNLPSSQSRYVTQMYDNLTAIEQAYNSYHTALKTGQYDKARNELQDNRALIGSYHMAEAAKRTESMLTLQEKRIQNSTTLSADTKRTMLNRVAQQRAAIAERISSAELSRQQ